MPAPSGCSKARSNNRCLQFFPAASDCPQPQRILGFRRHSTVQCPVLREVACNAKYASKRRTSGHAGGGAKATAEEAVWGCRRQIARILHSALPRPCSGPARRNTPLHQPCPQASLTPTIPQRGAGVRARGRGAEGDCGFRHKLPLDNQARVHARPPRACAHHPLRRCSAPAHNTPRPLLALRGTGRRGAGAVGIAKHAGSHETATQATRYLCVGSPEGAAPAATAR